MHRKSSELFFLESAVECNVLRQHQTSYFTSTKVMCTVELPGVGTWSCYELIIVTHKYFCFAEVRGNTRLPKHAKWAILLGVVLMCLQHRPWLASGQQFEIFRGTARNIHPPTHPHGLIENLPTVIASGLHGGTHSLQQIRSPWVRTNRLLSFSSFKLCNLKNANCQLHFVLHKHFLVCLFVFAAKCS
jgi:hypothetical protein